MKNNAGFHCWPKIYNQKKERAAVIKVKAVSALVVHKQARQQSVSSFAMPCWIAVAAAAVANATVQTNFMEILLL